MLKDSEAMEVSVLLKDLVKLDSVTIALQSESLIMSELYRIHREKSGVRACVSQTKSGRKLTPTEKAANTKLLASATEEATGKEESGDEE
ncbi:hypothetical protein GQ600_10932 [Phytophthora cactorum]|nr:hypothetical protein GQ600_10932 [Phytophthora cactorum]